MILDASLLNTEHYKVRIKGNRSIPGKGIASPQHHYVVAVEKETFRSASTTIDQHRYERMRLNIRFIYQEVLKCYPVKEYKKLRSHPFLLFIIISFIWLK